MGLFAPADALVTFAALVAWIAVLHSSDVLQYAALGADAGFWFTALAVSTSHVLYAVVWFAPSSFRLVAEQGALRGFGSNAVGVFAVLVGAAKAAQQLGALAFALAATECAKVGSSPSHPEWSDCTTARFSLTSAPAVLLELLAAAQPAQWLVAILLLAAGQVHLFSHAPFQNHGYGIGGHTNSAAGLQPLTTRLITWTHSLCSQALNAAIYAAIGKDGVYYGFKLGRPVPWCTGFPFNLGFRHPQYVGGFCSQLGVLALLATPVRPRPKHAARNALLSLS